MVEPNPHRITTEEITTYDATFKFGESWIRVPLEVLCEHISFKKEFKTKSLREFQDYLKYETEQPIQDIQKVIQKDPDLFESILYSYKMYNIVTEEQWQANQERDLLMR